MESREHLLQSFLSKTNWKKATRIPLASDASGRTYERLSLDSNCAILMNAPYATGEDVRPFITVTNILNDLNLSAPVIYHQDIQNGFLLLEDLGNDLFASICKKSPEMENLIYSAAVDLLLYLHEKPTPPNLSKYDLKVYVREAKLLIEWYLPFALGRPISKEIIKEFDIILNTTFSKIPSKNPVLVMRDYHAENLIWLPKRLNVNKVGLLDYQDALVGHPAYDLVSLLE
ncbi:phosphotransferase, partial [Amylibacter sp.]|nr:phosphotransferase [Amylibacter sp.]MDB9754461.1 phosphotransferase [Amylibacter sp.]